MTNRYEATNAGKRQKMQNNFNTACFLLGNEVQLRGCPPEDWATFQHVIGEVIEVGSVGGHVVSEMFVENLKGLMGNSLMHRIEKDVELAKNLRERIAANDEYDYSDETPEYDF